MSVSMLTGAPASRALSHVLINDNTTKNAIIAAIITTIIIMVIMDIFINLFGFF